jgi:ABC-2 type transport system permease protein
MTPSLGTQVFKLARRSIARTLRQPAVVVPNLLFPIILLAILSAGGDKATDIKGFPTDSYITFILGATLVQGAVTATTMAGGALGNDISSGFLSRLTLTRVSKTALLAAQLAGVAVLGVVQAAIYLLVGLAGGASIEAGVAGAFALIGFVVLMTLAFGSVGLLTAVRTGSAERVQGLFPLALGLLFMSSMVMPRNLIEKSWFEKIATYNPMSYLVEAPRSLLINGWDGEALALGCGIATAMLVLSLAAAVAQMGRQFVRT